MNKCAAGLNFQEIADFCRCKFTEPLTDEIDRLQTENKQLRDCHEAELGVCQQHCDIVITLQAENKRLRTLIINMDKWAKDEALKG